MSRQACGQMGWHTVESETRNGVCLKRKPCDHEATEALVVRHFQRSQENITKNQEFQFFGAEVLSLRIQQITWKA